MNPHECSFLANLYWSDNHGFRPNVRAVALGSPLHFPIYITANICHATQIIYYISHATQINFNICHATLLISTCIYHYHITYTIIILNYISITCPFFTSILCYRKTCTTPCIMAYLPTILTHSCLMVPSTFSNSLSLWSPTKLTKLRKVYLRV